MADFSLSDIKALMGDGDANGIVWVLLIVLLMGGGGSSGGTKFYDFSFAASSETRYFDKNLTANDFINAYLRDDTLNPGVILYIPILHVLDTGSVHSLINKSVIQYIEYNETEYVATLSGIDNITREEENAIEIPLQYKGKVTRSIFVVTELSACFDEIKKETGVQLHGLLGSDFFVENRYIIDYNEMVAYSKRI